MQSCLPSVLGKNKTMADLIAPNRKGSRAHKMPRIDLTPMVDLGFLLITFFMYTTALAKPKVMTLSMPTDGPASVWVEASTITIIPTEGHRMLVYTGTSQQAQNLAWCGFGGPDNLRLMICQAKENAAHLPAGFSKEAHRLHIVIKPDARCSYADLMQVLDEMLISDVKYYVLVKKDAGDDALLAAYGK